MADKYAVWINQPRPGRLMREDEGAYPKVLMFDTVNEATATLLDRGYVDDSKADTRHSAYVVIHDPRFSR